MKMQRPFAVLFALSFCALGGIFSTPAVSYGGILKFQLTIAEDPLVVTNPNNTNAQMLAANKSAHQLMIARDNPYMILSNISSEPGAEITKLTISLGNLAYNNDVLSMLSMSPGISYTLLNIDGQEEGLRSDHLFIKFTGFTPGKFVSFQANIDPDAGNTHNFTDYRDVLFNTAQNPASNAAKVQVNFKTPTNPATQTNKQFFPSYPELPAVASSIGFGNSTQQVVYSEDFKCNVPVYLTGDPDERVIPFVMVGQQISIVPEPSSLLLIGVVAVGAVGYCVRRSRAC
jgi:hypothetical protein